MTSLCVEYILCRTVEQAVQGLVSADGQARILAGGSDLLLELQQGLRPPVRRLVDVTEVDEMTALELRGPFLFIGAAVTLARLRESPLVKRHAQALVDAARLMANPQVCNVATIGGNVAHALPAADGTIALLALNTQAEIADPQGRRRLPLLGLFKGPGESSLDPCNDVLVGFHLPLPKEGQASAFSRRVNPQGVALALLNLAVWLDRRGEWLEDIRIVVGPSGPVPTTLETEPAVMRHKQPSTLIMEQAVQAILQEAHFRTSLHRATLEYRQHLVSVLLDEAFSAAWHRAEIASNEY
jgi:CO/xanthine dehydrogenase FAD-binding subunit